MTVPELWGLAAIVAKFALYLGLLTSAGTVMATQLFRLDRCTGFCVAFAGLGLGAALLTFLLQAVVLTGDASGMTEPDILQLLWSTASGTALSYRIVGLTLLILGLFIGRIGLWLSILGGLVAILSFGQVGHIASRETSLLQAALILHLTTIAIWIGILTPLRRLTFAHDTWSRAADVGHRFGQFASVMVPILIFAGGVMSVALVGSFTAFVGTGYGLALILKLGAVAGLLLLAAANKLRFVPGLRTLDPRAAALLRRSIFVEWLAICSIFAVTACMTTSLTLPT